MNDKLNMDKTIREKLDGFSVAPPAHLWNSIQGQMVAQKRKRRLAYIAWVSVAALVVFAFLAGWYFNDQSGEILPAFAEQEKVSPKKEVPTTVEQNDVSKQNDKTILNSEKAKSKSIADIKAIQAFNDAQSMVEKSEESPVLSATIERNNYDLLESLQAIFMVKEEDINLAENQKEQKQVLSITAADELLIAENIKNSKQYEPYENGWIVGAHLSPAYSSHSSSHEKQYAQNMTYSGSDGNGNVGGGFSVQYKTGKRLRVESGVYYSQNGQKSSHSLGGLFSFNNKKNDGYVYASPSPGDASNVGVADDVFSNSVRLSNEGITMNSTAGVIIMQTAPEGTLVATDAELANAKSTNTLITNGEFSQVFEFVEIPLSLRYSVLDKKFGIELVGGVNAGFVVGNAAYINNDFGNQKIGSTQDISKLNFSGIIGVGMNYALGKHVSLALEPRLNYYLSSINSNPDVTYRPYRIGVFTGVYYEF